MAGKITVEEEKLFRILLSLGEASETNLHGF